MDQLLRRTRMAERQVARRLKVAASQRYDSKFKASRNKERGDRHSEADYFRKQAARVRREDWEMGPLAPRRDVPHSGDMAGVNDIAWGSIGAGRVRLSTTQTEKELEASAAWAGGLKNLCLAIGDRCVVMEGHWKGKIGKITKIDKDSAGVELEDIGKVNATVPGYLRAQVGGKVTTIPQTFPIAAVRLVHPLKRKDGEIRDVIIRELRPAKVLHDRVSRRSTFSRVVPGLNVKIPWPDVPAAEYKDYEGDTLRIDVDERTFVPTLTRPPMPASVIDELRNQYSKFRTRHTDEYIAQKEAEQAEKEARRRSHETMMTPIEEFNRRQRELRRARGQPELNEEMLQKIGQVIVKNRKIRSGGGANKLEDAVKNLSIAEESGSTSNATTAPTA